MTFVRAFLIFSIAFLLNSFSAQAEMNAELLTGQFDQERIDALVVEHSRDPRLVFDLLGVKGDMLVDGSDFSNAADIALVRVALATRFPDKIVSDVPSLHQDAANLLFKAGKKELALEQLYAVLIALRQRAANQKILVEIILQIADLEEELGRSERAAQLRTQADDLPDPLSTPPSTRSNDPGYVDIDVYYATDRARTGASNPSRFYGYGRAEELDYGIVNVSIPNNHIAGTIAAPSIWKLEFSHDPAKHVMLQSVSPVKKDEFFGNMRSTLIEKDASDAFVFIHGYNVSFDAAAKRTAQLAYDMNFKGLPVLYSWPSRGATIGYIPDTAVVRLSGRRLTHFLEDLANKSGATTIHLIAHSMGNRAVTDALELMALRLAPVEKPIFDQVIFAAPDVDKGLFSEMLPTIRPLARRLTLYASEQDWALEASRKLHGNHQRAGQGGSEVLEHDDIDTIDMSGLGDDMLAHSYVANDQSAILDISILFWRNPNPKERCGLKARADAPDIWDYTKSDCSSLSLLSLVGSLRNEGALSKEQVRATLKRDFGSEPKVKVFENLLLEIATD